MQSLFQHKKSVRAGHSLGSSPAENNRTLKSKLQLNQRMLFFICLAIIHHDFCHGVYFQQMLFGHTLNAALSVPRLLHWPSRAGKEIQISISMNVSLLYLLCKFHKIGSMSLQKVDKPKSLY